MSVVSLVKVGNYSELRKAIERSFELIGFHFTQNLRKIVVKPNMCCYSDYSTGETTDPRIVAALLDVLRGSIATDLQISVVESDASAMKLKYSSKVLGYEKMCKEKRVPLVNLTDERNEEAKVEVAGHSYTFSLPTTIKDADLFINMPKMKYMLGTEISCAMKNIYGCNPYPKKFEYHQYLDEVIVALNKIMKPDLCLLDGIMVRGKCTRKMDLLMASADPVALDTVAAKIMGINPKRISHIVLAEEEGVGTSNYELVGESLQVFARRFPKKGMADKARLMVGRLALSTLRKLGFKTPPF